MFSTYDSLTMTARESRLRLAQLVSDASACEESDPAHAQHLRQVANEVLDRYWRIRKQLSTLER